MPRLYDTNPDDGLETRHGETDGDVANKRPIA